MAAKTSGERANEGEKRPADQISMEEPKPVREHGERSKLTAADEIRQKVADADRFAAAQGFGRCFSDSLIAGQIIRRYLGADGTRESGGTIRISMPASANLSGPDKVQHRV